MAPSRFRDRADAGRVLARMLGHYANRSDTIVLALPRGGVPVGYELARALRAPLDVFVVRKLGAPGHEELGVGAIASGGTRYVDEALVARLGLSGDELDVVTRREQAELERREAAYRDGLPPPLVEGKRVILVDDGLATGGTMRAAIAALRQRAPAAIVMAVPVGSPDVCALFEQLADERVCAMMPEPLVAVGLWYDEFAQTSDDEVRELLRRARDETHERVR